MCQILTLKLEFALESDNYDTVHVRIRVRVRVGFHPSVGFILLIDIVKLNRCRFCPLVGFLL